MTCNNQHKSQNERRRHLNMALSVLPPFASLTDHKIYLINQTTLPMLVEDLIQLARQTTRFTIDTEYDYHTHEPALIQIEFLQTHSVVLLIETCHLPHRSSVLFWLIRTLMQIIFQPANVLYAWGDLIFELGAFALYGLFSLQAVYQINPIDVQRCFKTWYNQNYLHTCGLRSFEDDSRLCTCLHRPVKQSAEQWSLQRAIAYTFNEFLDKSRTRSCWSYRLSLNSNLHQYSSIMKTKWKINNDHLILYAVNDCLAVTKLMMIVDFNWSRETVLQYNLTS